ncbi:hypothetical protein [Jeotgalibacillus proteolyticus]|uniref:hypothetical protein n=1 Tax=Jeotgalibacillus proteolyticus TaxID=2082395 RepID=UPI00143179AF|nr:hypothetical protein [Jeotgalibacillus proteolyticus]
MLKTFNPRVYYQTRSASAAFPYIIYSFLPSFTEEELEVLPLDIDIWDNKTDTTEIEELASQLWKDLRQYHHIDKDMQFVIYRQSRMPELDEAETGLRRRKLTFHIRYFDRTI